MPSLWGPEFDIENKEKTKQLAKSLKKKAVVKEQGASKILKSKLFSLDEKLATISENVYRILGVYKDQTLVIKTRKELTDYISKSIENDIIAIDTETNNSLAPITCKLMGGCIYTPGLKNAYIPVNHVNKDTNERLGWQLTEKDIYEEFSRLNDIKIIAHNGKFDYEVLKCTTGWKMPVYWDTFIAAKMLNENEKAGLKYQYVSKIDPSIEKYSIEYLFEDVEYAVVDPEVFALYAATDSFMTHKLYEYQLEELSKPENKRLFDVFMQIEMPAMEALAEMELTGISIDLDYCAKLRDKYCKKLEIISKQIDDELVSLKPTIDKWRLTKEANEKPKKKDSNELGKSKNEQLQDPPALSSPIQLAILLYDILKVGVIDSKAPRGTGKEILAQIDLPLCKLMTEEKTLAKLIDAFLVPLPTLVCPKDGKIHSHFNQLGAATGRQSSTEPNLQQIPSKNYEMRKMFMSSPGKLLVGADYSSQEPRILAAFSNDDRLLDAFKNNKDIYATIGTGVFKNNYWDNMEHYEDGSDNVDGTKRRKKCKTLLLGMMYGMGSGLLSKKMGVTKEEGQQIINDFYTGFPKVKDWMTKLEAEAKSTGYVQDFFGRRRRLPDLLLPEYEFKDHNNSSTNFNPFLGTKNRECATESKEIKQLRQQLEKANFREKAQIKQLAQSMNIDIIDNGGFISRAERQCVNGAIQASAASMTKRAIAAVYRDPLINQLGFKLLLSVHDELIGECPEENAEAVAKRLSQIMVECGSDIPVSFKCDAEIENHWYDNNYKAAIRKEYNDYLETLSSPEALKKITELHPETDSNILVNYCVE